MIRNTILGIHTATTGGVFPFTAKVEDTVWKTMYPKLSAIPIPKFNPIPPLTFFAERATPMSVNINAANEVAVAKFLAGQIKFLEIEDLIEEALNKHSNILNPTLEEILEVDQKTRMFVSNMLVR